MVSPLPVPSAPEAIRRRGLRELLLLLGIESFANSLAGNFWLVYLVSPPSSLPFPAAVSTWLLMYAVAVGAVYLYGRQRSHHATRSMVVGLVLLAIGHASFAILPPLGIILVASVCFGIYFPTFWLPLNVLLVRQTSASNRAARLALVTATFTTVAIVAPVLGGIIADRFGYPVLFGIGAVISASDIPVVRFLEQREETLEFRLDIRGTGTRAAIAISGQGAVEGLTAAATPLASYLFTSAALDLGLLFSFFSLLSGLAIWILGRVSDRVRRRAPFLLIGPLLSVPACILAATAKSLDTFALSVGVLSMTMNVAPSFIYTVLVDRMETSVPNLTITREVLLNASRAIASAAGIGLLLLIGSSSAIYLLYFFVAVVILLESLAK